MNHNNTRRGLTVVNPNVPRQQYRARINIEGEENLAQQLLEQNQRLLQENFHLRQQNQTLSQELRQQGMKKRSPKKRSPKKKIFLPR